MSGRSVKAPASNEFEIDGVEREAVADTIAEATNLRIERRYARRGDDTLLAQLRSNGIVKIPELQLSTSTIAEILRHLESKPVYAAHVQAHSDGIGRSLADPEAKKFPFGSYSLSDAVSTPHLLELAFDPRILSLAEGYLGCAPSLFSVHSWWTFPGHQVAGPQTFHRDYDDYRFLALFVFLTDVEGGVAGGEHEFVESTHTMEALTRAVGDDASLASEFFYPKSKGTVHDEGPLYRKLFGEKVRSVTGKAGSVFLADTYGLHRGVRPTRDGRLVCWIRYGLRKNGAYDVLKSHSIPFDWSSGRIPDDAYTRYVARLILQ